MNLKKFSHDDWNKLYKFVADFKIIFVIALLMIVAIPVVILVDSLILKLVIYGATFILANEFLDYILDRIRRKLIVPLEKELHNIKENNKPSI